MTSPNTDYLTNLDDEQKQAVLAPTDKPILVVAGAGSGKTTTLVARCAHLISSLGYPPESLILTTFTRNAAQEIISRVEQVVGPKAQFVQASTIHSLCLKILRDNLRKVDVIEQPLQRRLISDATDHAYEALGIRANDKRRLGWRYWTSWIDWARTNHQPTTTQIYAQMEKSRPGGGLNRILSKVAAEIYAEYESQKAGLYDFTDMLVKCRELLEDARVLEGLRAKYRYVMVDESQDTSSEQLEILELIAQDRLFMVGDGDQSLYQFRGATPEQSIFGFLRRHPNGQIVHLNTNYRSTQKIVSAARTLIHNQYLGEEKQAYEKSTKPRPDAQEGADFVLVRPENATHEAEWVTSQIQGLLDENDHHPQDFFVLARTNAALALTEEQLTVAGIPAVSSGGSFWDNNRVADVVSIIALAHSPHDDAAFLRCYDIPSPMWELTTRRLGRRFIEDVQNTKPIHPDPPSLWNRMLTLKERDKPFRVRAMRDFMSYRDGVGVGLENLPLGDVFAQVVEDYSDWWVRKEGPEAVEDLEILEPLIQIAARLKTMENLFAHAAMIKSAQKSKDKSGAVVLSTIHGAKGLERPIVFVVGMSDGVIPHWMSDGEISVRTASRGGNGGKTLQMLNRSRMPPSPYDGKLEDERCAAYVLVTRAKDRLYISAPAEVGSKVELSPSRFIHEMGLDLEDAQPVEFIEEE